MKIIFLGTSQAVPDRERGQTSILISYGSENILVDCGEGTQRQFKIAGLNPCKITKILITHWHGDHVLGLPGLLQTLALNNYSRILEIYGPLGTKKFLDLIMSMFVFRNQLKISVKEIEGGIFFKNQDFKLEAWKMKHPAKCLAYAFIEEDKRRVKMSELKKIGMKEGPWLKELQEGKDLEWEGKKISAARYTALKKGKKIVFIFDTTYNDNCIKISRDADLLISEACFTSEHEKFAQEREHLTAEQAARIAKNANVKKLILTHVSQRYADKTIVVKEAKKIFKNVTLAKDFMKIEF